MLSSGSAVFQRLQNLLCIQQLCDLASGLLSWALLDLLPVLCALTWSSWVFLSVSYAFVMVQFSSVTQSCLTLCDPMDCNTSGLPVHHQLPELAQVMSIESVVPSNHLILRHPLLLLPSIFLSIRVFFNEPALRLRWPKSKVLEFQLQHQSFQ